MKIKLIVLLFVFFGILSALFYLKFKDIKEYKVYDESVFKYYLEISNYKACKTNLEVEKYLKKENLLPLFRLENYSCYSIWFAKGKEEEGKGVFIYSVIKDFHRDPTLSNLIMKNKTLMKLKSITTSYIVRETIKLGKNQYKNKEHLYEGELSFFIKKLDSEATRKLEKLIQKLDKNLFTCRKWADDFKRRRDFLRLFLSSKEASYQGLYLNYPLEKLPSKSEGLRYYEDEGCFELKKLVDSIFNLTKN